MTIIYTVKGCKQNRLLRYVFQENTILVFLVQNFTFNLSYLLFTSTFWVKIVSKEIFF